MTNAQDTRTRRRPRFSLSNLILLTAVAATATMWYLDNRATALLRAELEALRAEAKASRDEAERLQSLLAKHIQDANLLRHMIGMAIDRGDIERAGEIVRTGHYDYKTETAEHELWLHRSEENERAAKRNETSVNEHAESRNSHR